MLKNRHVTIGAVSVLVASVSLAVCHKPEEAAEEKPSTASQELSEHDKLVQTELAELGSQLAVQRDSAAQSFGLAVSEPDTVSEDDLAAYGTRAGFFSWTPKTYRPDPNWRTVLDDRLADEQSLWSQGFEELIIRDFFGDRRGGVFLDVGCFRPKFDSTTYFLENNLGWSGIGIDAMSEHAKAWEEHRPNSKFISYAISDKDGEKVTFHVGFVTNALDEDIVKSFGGKKKEIEVTTMTLNTILEQNGISKIDFLSMDIEGGEPAALRGFDIQRYKPELCCVEGVSKEEVMEYFSANGYELIEKYRKVDKINYYFRPKSDN